MIRQLLAASTTKKLWSVMGSLWVFSGCVTESLGDRFAREHVRKADIEWIVPLIATAPAESIVSVSTGVEDPRPIVEIRSLSGSSIVKYSYGPPSAQHTNQDGVLRQLDYRVTADGIDDVFRNLSRLIRKGYVHRDKSRFGWPLIERHIALVAEPSATLTVEEGVRTEQFTSFANEWACERQHKGEASQTDLAEMLFDADIYASEASLICAALVDFDFMCQLLYESQGRRNTADRSPPDGEN